jgi:hypothetical protein
MTSPTISGMLMQQKQSEISMRAAYAHRYERIEDAPSCPPPTRGRLRRALLGLVTAARP